MNALRIMTESVRNKTITAAIIVNLPLSGIVLLHGNAVQ